MPHAPALRAQRHANSPYGPVLLARTDKGLAGLWNAGQAHHPPVLNVPEERHPWFDTALAALEAWGSWARHENDPPLPPLDPHGTPFQMAVWARLRAIPRGGLTSYGAIAQDLGRPQASRAVGAAVGRNPIGILVPCHRVVGARGELTGYAGGLPLKTLLLQQEGVLI
jgi:methylated-DNA-[protein]-cysteine S-methyltransferase